jgi:hypothetical protein
MFSKIRKFWTVGRKLCFLKMEHFKCLLFRCRHAVVIMQTLIRTNQCPLFMTVRHIFEISEDDHPSLVTHARDNWWTLNFANAFVSPGVNSRGELVPSHGASRRRLGENLSNRLESLKSTTREIRWHSLNFSSRMGIKQFDYCSKCLNIFQITLPTAKFG